MVVDLVAAGLATDAAALGATNVVLWLLSLVLGKTWPVDFVWSTFPLVMCARVMLGNREEGVCDRQLLVCVCVAVWGLRLTQNFISRGGIGHEDWRYADMRNQFGAHFWWISLFSVFLGQTIFLFAGCLSIYGCMLSPRALAPTDALAVAVCVLAIWLEAAADLQMDTFQAARREKRTDATVIDRGLWMWSRHPNYLGELSWWWGLYFFGAPAVPAWVAAGPGAMTFLFVGISIKLMEDRQMKLKPEAFSAYRRAVPSSLLLLPPPLNRALGRWLHRTDASVKPEERALR